MDFFEGFSSWGFYILLFSCRNKTISLSISLEPLSISPTVSFKKKLCFDFWFNITILGISEKNYLSLQLVFLFLMLFWLLGNICFLFSNMGLLSIKWCSFYALFISFGPPKWFFIWICYS